MLAAVPSISGDKWIRLVEIGSIPLWVTPISCNSSPLCLDLRVKHHVTSQAFTSNPASAQHAMVETEPCEEGRGRQVSDSLNLLFAHVNEIGVLQ